jgi:hypothetical protein
MGHPTRWPPPRPSFAAVAKAAEVVGRQVGSPRASRRLRTRPDPARELALAGSAIGAH